MVRHLLRRVMWVDFHGRCHQGEALIGCNRNAKRWTNDTDWRLDLCEDFRWKLFQINNRHRVRRRVPLYGGHPIDQHKLVIVS